MKADRKENVMQSIDSVVVQPMQWSDVRDIDAVRPISNEDAPILRELREVLRKHGALNRFGFTLIHNHFDIGPDEHLLESIDVDARVLTIRPVATKELGATIQTAWRFAESDTGTEPVLVCRLKCPWKPGTSEHAGVRHENFP